MAEESQKGEMLKRLYESNLGLFLVACAITFPVLFAMNWVTFWLLGLVA